MPIWKLKVNGREESVEAEAHRPLINVLRVTLGLTGTKLGCGEAQCGSCTILMDGNAARSCVTTVADAAGKQITTIEGLARGGKLHPVQDAFLETTAFQCGFCTPGMIMQSVALLGKNPRPSAGQIGSALEGNICRCGAHPRIVEAVRMASGGRNA